MAVEAAKYGNKTLVLSDRQGASGQGSVFFGEFDASDGITAYSKLVPKLNPLCDYRNPAMLVGGLVKDDGTVEMKSTTVNGITWTEFRDCAQYAGIAAAALNAGRCVEIPA